MPGSLWKSGVLKSGIRRVWTAASGHGTRGSALSLWRVSPPGALCFAVDKVQQTNRCCFKKRSVTRTPFMPSEQRISKKIWRSIYYLLGVSPHLPGTLNEAAWMDCLQMFGPLAADTPNTAPQTAAIVRSANKLLAINNPQRFILWIVSKPQNSNFFFFSTRLGFLL